MHKKEKFTPQFINQKTSLTINCKASQCTKDLHVLAAQQNKKLIDMKTLP